MPTMNISLPATMKRWVERQAKIAHMQGLVGEGVASGKSTRTMKELKELARLKAGA